MIKVEEKTIKNGWDCYGRTEYKDVYVVLDENDYEIFRSTENPTKLIEKIIKDCEKSYEK